MASRWLLPVLLCLLGTVGGFVVVAPLVIPLPEQRGLVAAEDLADADSRFETVAGLKVHFKMAQPPGGHTREPAMVFLHSGAHSLQSFTSVMGSLSVDRKTLAFDRAGYGLTARPMAWAGQNPYTATFQADMVVALMDRLGLGRAILVGNSAGGTIAMLTALKHPQRVASLVLLSPGVYSGLGKGSGALTRALMRTPQLRRVGPAILRRQLGHGTGELFRKFWHEPGRLTDDMLKDLQRPMQIFNWAEALYQVGLVMEPLGVQERLSELTMPALVVTGDDDTFVPLEENQRLVRELPNASLAVLKDCGHVPHQECAQAFVAQVIPFVRKVALQNKP
jgi:pimeloyl-ACP methyl ester carboxylesterase